MHCKRYKVSLSDAQQTLHDLLGKPSVQTLTLEEAEGRRLSQDVWAPRPVPSQPLALRDGMALLEAGAVAVRTGEAMPPGSRGLVKSENIEKPGVAANPHHIRQPGQDVGRGERVLAAGTWLDAWNLAVLRTAGVTKVEVWSRPRIQLEAPDGGTSQWMVAKRLTELGAELVTRDPQLTVVLAGDEPGSYGRLMTRFDDFPFEIWKVAVRPGKHVAMGRRDGVPLVVLPDHLVATWISLALLLEPAVRRLSGEPETPLPLAEAPEQTGEAGLTQALWARWHNDRLIPLCDQFGQLPVAFREADALLLVPPEGGCRLPFVPLSRPSCTTTVPSLAKP